MSASQTSQSSHIPSAGSSALSSSTHPLSGRRQSSRLKGGPPPPTRSQSRAASRTPLTNNDEVPSKPVSSSAMRTRSRRRGDSPATSTPASSSTATGGLRYDPLLDVLIEQKKRPLQGVIQLEGISPEEVEKAARHFLGASGRCFRTTLAAMELEEEEMESDMRSQERNNVMSAWDEMLLAGRVFLDCNQFEVASSDDVKDRLQEQNGPLTDKTNHYLNKAIRLFNITVLIKNISVPDSVAVELEELGAGAPADRVTARNAVLKNLWASFWHIVPEASNKEMDIWIQFSVQLSARFQSHRILEERCIRDTSLPKPKKGTFLGQDVFANLTNLDQSSDRYKRLSARWKARVKAARQVASRDNPPEWQTLEDSVLDYIREKSGDLLDFNIAEDEEDSIHHPPGVQTGEVSPALGSQGAGSDQTNGASQIAHDAEDVSMTEPLDMDLFLELAQELEAEKAASSPPGPSPLRPALPPLIRLGVERPTPSFDWLARQKDAVQITWETQDSRLSSPHHRTSSQPADEPDDDELPGETQLRGADVAFVGMSQIDPSDHGQGVEDDDELPTMTQLQGDTLAQPEAIIGPTTYETQDSDNDLPPPPLLNGESDALPHYQSTGDGSDIDRESDDDIPSETQLHGDISAFAGTEDGHEQALSRVAEEEDDSEGETQLPTDTQLYGDSDALADLPQTAGLQVVFESDELPAPDQFSGPEVAKASQAGEQTYGRKSVAQEFSPNTQEHGLPDVDQLAGDVDGLNIASQTSERGVLDFVSPAADYGGLPDAAPHAGDDGELNIHNPATEPAAAEVRSSEAEDEELPDLEQLEGEDSELDLDDGHGGLIADKEWSGTAFAGSAGVTEDQGYDNEHPPVDQLEGELEARSDDDEKVVAQHLEDQALLGRELSQSLLGTPGAQEAEPGGSRAEAELPQLSHMTVGAAVAAETKALSKGACERPERVERAAVAGGPPRQYSPNARAMPGDTQRQEKEAAATANVNALDVAEAVPGSSLVAVADVPAEDAVVQNDVETAVLHEEVEAVSPPSPADQLVPRPESDEAQVSPMSTANSKAAKNDFRKSTRQPQQRHGPDPRTEFASPDPEDGPVERGPSTPADAVANLRGPRRAQHLRTDSPSRRSERFSPPMLLPVVPRHQQIPPQTPNQPLVREHGSGVIKLTATRSASIARRAEPSPAVTPRRQHALTDHRSEGAASVDPSRRDRSTTGRLGYIAPQNDPYLHDEDGGPLEPDPDFVTPDVYPTPLPQRGDRRTVVPMHRKYRRWTEPEALLLYRTVQKAWWSERTAQQVAWYLHGEWGQLSQRLKAFTVQNMKDKMREIVKTRVRNERAVVGRARHWLPVNHPDRQAYEEEMAEWADAENERLRKERERLEEEEDDADAVQQAYQSQSDREDMDSEASVADQVSAIEELQDEEMDWEANSEMLVDVDNSRRVSSQRRCGGPRHGGPVLDTRARPQEVAAIARWRTDNEEEMDELASDGGGDMERADDPAEDISIADSDTGLADPADFPPPVDVVMLLRSHKRHPTAPLGPSAKRRHTFATEFNRPLAKPTARPSLPASGRSSITFGRKARPALRQLNRSGSDSSEGAAPDLPSANRVEPSNVTPRLVPRYSTLARSEPRPSRHFTTTASEIASPRAQSSPSRPLRPQRRVQRSSSATDSEKSDYDDYNFRPGDTCRLTADGSPSGGVLSTRESAPRSEAEAISSADESGHFAPPKHRRSDSSPSPITQKRGASHHSPLDTQASLGDTQSLGLLAPRTTVVARARRGGMKQGLSRHLSVVAERTESIENRKDLSALIAPGDSSTGSGIDSEGEENAGPAQSQSSRLREIARKVMGV